LEKRRKSSQNGWRAKQSHWNVNLDYFNQKIQGLNLTVLIGKF